MRARSAPDRVPKKRQAGECGAIRPSRPFFVQLSQNNSQRHATARAPSPASNRISPRGTGMRPPPLLHPHQVGLAFPTIRVAGFAQPRPLARALLSCRQLTLPQSRCFAQLRASGMKNRCNPRICMSRSDASADMTPPVCRLKSAGETHPAITSVKKGKNSRKKYFSLFPAKNIHRSTRAFLTAR